MKNVFSVKAITNEVVVLEVHADDALVVALNPYIHSKMQYISVTRGRNHILTVIYKDGSQGVNFNWGESGHTLISDSLELLKKKVCEFIKSEGIMLDYDGFAIKELCLYYHPYEHKWQLRFEGVNRSAFEYLCDECLEKALMESIKFVRETEWHEGLAPTGITVYKCYKFDKNSIK